MKEAKKANVGRGKQKKPTEEQRVARLMAQRRQRGSQRQRKRQRLEAVAQEEATAKAKPRPRIGHIIDQCPWRGPGGIDVKIPSDDDLDSGVSDQVDERKVPIERRLPRRA